MPRWRYGRLAFWMYVLAMVLFTYSPIPTINRFAIDMALPLFLYLLTLIVRGWLNEVLNEGTATKKQTRRDWDRIQDRTRR